MQREMRDFVYVTMDVLPGILISGFVDRDDDRALRRWHRACISPRAIAPDLTLQ
jgi:hypothetical protein